MLRALGVTISVRQSKIVKRIRFQGAEAGALPRAFDPGEDHVEDIDQRSLGDAP